MHSFKKIIKTVIVVALAAAILLGLDFFVISMYLYAK